MTTKRTSKAIPNFEASLKQLESIVDKMEKQELSLEDALSNFEEGITLTKSCQKALTQAKQKVEKLIDEKNNG